MEVTRTDGAGSDTVRPSQRRSHLARYLIGSPFPAIAVLFIQPLIFFHRHLFAQTVHIPFDIQGFHLPLVSFIARCLRDHVAPLWDPLSYCGVPIHADIQAQLFYPLSWPVILKANLSGGSGLFYWLEWMNPIHMFLGGYFTWLLLRKLNCSIWVAFFGATVYQLGPFFASQAQHTGAISSAAWFPLTILCIFELATRYSLRWVAILALSIGLSFLSGFPATTVVVLSLGGLLCVLLALTRQAKWGILISYAGGCALGGGLAAVQLLPTNQLTQWSVASLRYLWKGNGGGLHPQALVSFFAPNHYHIFSAFDRTVYKLPFDFTMLYTFCGYLAIVLIAAAPFFVLKSKPIAVSLCLFVTSIVWMLGEYTPLYPPIFRHLPHVLQGAIYAEYAMLGFALFAAILCALVLSRFSIKLHPIVLGILIIANSWNLMRTGANRVFNTADGNWNSTERDWNDGGRLVFQSLKEWGEAAYPPLRTDYLPGYYLDVRTRNEMVPLWSADGDNPFMPLRYLHLRQLFSDGVPWDREQLLKNITSPWIRALNVGFVIGGKGIVDPAAASLAGFSLLPFDNVFGFKVPAPLPRFYLAKRVVPVADETAALAVARQPSFNPLDQTIVEGIGAHVPQPSEDQPPVHVIKYENNRVELETDSPAPSFLVSSETLYPGWRVTINDHDAAIFPTNIAFRGIPLPAGHSRIVMTYAPRLFWAGLILTILSLALITALLVVKPKKQAYVE